MNRIEPEIVASDLANWSIKIANYDISRIRVAIEYSVEIANTKYKDFVHRIIDCQIDNDAVSTVLLFSNKIGYRLTIEDSKLIDLFCWGRFVVVYLIPEVDII